MTEPTHATTPECINPDISLAELYKIRSGYKNRIKITFDPELNASLKESLKGVNERIGKVEHAMETGGIVRLM